jgi:hypothetical protein
VSSALLIALAVLVLVLLLTGLVAAARAGQDRRGRSPLEERERAIATQIEVEEHDIGEMIEARNAIRRRRGLPSVGEELGERARDPDD